MVSSKAIELLSKMGPYHHARVVLEGVLRELKNERLRNVLERDGLRGLAIELLGLRIINQLEGRMDERSLENLEELFYTDRKRFLEMARQECEKHGLSVEPIEELGRLLEIPRTRERKVNRMAVEIIKKELPNYLPEELRRELDNLLKNLHDRRIFHKILEKERELIEKVLQTVQEHPELMRITPTRDFLRYLRLVNRVFGLYLDIEPRNWDTGEVREVLDAFIEATEGRIYRGRELDLHPTLNEALKFVERIREHEHIGRTGYHLLMQWIFTPFLFLRPPSREALTPSIPEAPPIDMTTLSLIEEALSPRTPEAPPATLSPREEVLTPPTPEAPPIGMAALSPVEKAVTSRYKEVFEEISRNAWNQMQKKMLEMIQRGLYGDVFRMVSLPFKGVVILDVLSLYSLLHSTGVKELNELTPERLLGIFSREIKCPPLTEKQKQVLLSYLIGDAGIGEVLEEFNLKIRDLVLLNTLEGIYEVSEEEIGEFQKIVQNLRNKGFEDDVIRRVLVRAFSFKISSEELQEKIGDLEKKGKLSKDDLIFSLVPQVRNSDLANTITRLIEPIGAVLDHLIWGDSEWVPLVAGRAESVNASNEREVDQSLLLGCSYLIRDIGARLLREIRDERITLLIPKLELIGRIGGETAAEGGLWSLLLTALEEGRKSEYPAIMPIVQLYFLCDFVAFLLENFETLKTALIENKREEFDRILQSFNEREFIRKFLEYLDVTMDSDLLREMVRVSFNAMSKLSWQSLKELSVPSLFVWVITFQGW